MRIRFIDKLKTLSDDYYLINDVLLGEAYGNIDHIVLGPNGLFTIETKNYVGTFSCEGDDWRRIYEDNDTINRYTIGSPSMQVKRNALNLKNF